MVCVEEIPYMPDYAEEVREEKATAGRRFHTVLQRARTMAEAQQLSLHPHVLAGHPVRNIVKLAADLGARGHSALYERMIGSRADRVIQLAQCPVLVVK
jgi:nucleotide-binding universal stress UspA family protein